MSWSFATLALLAHTLMPSISQSAIRMLDQTLHFVNTSWAIAVLRLEDETGFQSIAVAAIRKISDFNSQSLSNTSWAFAVCLFRNGPLLASLSAEVLANGADTDNGHGYMMLWALWSASVQNRFRALAAAFPRADVEIASLLLMNAEWRRSAIEGMWEFGARSLTFLHLPVHREGHHQRANQKIVYALSLIGSCLASRASVRAVLRAAEEVARSCMWMKVAGGKKAALLRHVRFGSKFVAVECGAFIGYSALQASTSGIDAFVSLELDPLHAAAARVLACSTRSRSAAMVEPWIGLAGDLVHRVPEEFGIAMVANLFFDHVGTRYHVEHQIVEKLHALDADACLVADNALEPGAPLFLWRSVGQGSNHMPQSKHDQADSIAWALPEFLGRGIEDWVVVCGR